jgi:hypothetical protein
MTPFEEELKRALQRQEPGADFTQRVLARCASEATPQKQFGFWQTWRFTFATAALALLMLGGGVAYQQHERTVKGMAAKRQLLLAMRIAGNKLQQVQKKLKENEQDTQ